MYKDRCFFIILLIVLGIKLTSLKTTTEQLLLENIEALAAGEDSLPYSCIGSGSVDCPATGVKVKFIYSGFRL